MMGNNEAEQTWSYMKLFNIIPKKNSLRTFGSFHLLLLFLSFAKTDWAVVIKHAGLFGAMSGAPTCTGNISYSVFQCSGSLGTLLRSWQLWSSEALCHLNGFKIPLNALIYTGCLFVLAAVRWYCWEGWTLHRGFEMCRLNLLVCIGLKARYPIGIATDSGIWFWWNCDSPAL